MLFDEKYKEITENREFLKLKKTYEKNLNLMDNKLKKTKKENMKLLTEIDKLRNSLSHSEFYKYDKYGEISGFYPKILANKIEKQFKLLTPNANKSNMLNYENGAYIETNHIVLKKIREYISLKDQKNNLHENETLETIARDTYIDSKLLNSNDTYINFKNCLLDVNNNFAVKGHSPNVLTTIQINCNYNFNLSRKIKDTHFWKYINTSLSSEYMPLIQEIFGYVLSNSMQGQKFIVLLGDGKNGKSVFLNIIKSLYSSDLVSNVSIEDLQKKEFLANLYNKKLNLNGDIPETFLENTDVLKKLTGEDEINAKALYENPFDFSNKAKIIFSCNKLPKAKDKTFGYYRRFCIIPFVKRIKEKDKITDLDKIIINNELDIIASWAIEGLKRLIKNNFSFSETKQMQNVVIDYQNQNNSILQFVNDLTVKTENSSDFIPVVELKRMYKNWCNVENKKALSDFDYTLKKMGYRISTNSRISTQRHWKCLKWNKLVNEYNIYKDELKGVIDNNISSNLFDEKGTSDINYQQEFNNMNDLQLENIIKLASKKLDLKKRKKVLSIMQYVVKQVCENDEKVFVVYNKRLKYLENDEVFINKFYDFSKRKFTKEYISTDDYRNNVDKLLDHLNEVNIWT